MKFQDAAGRTPLHVAVIYRHSAVTRFLLSNGADPSTLDDFGRNAEYYASTGNKSNPYILYMMTRGLEADTALIEFASLGDAETVSLLLQNDANKDAAGKGSQTALMRASKIGHTKIIQILADAGADPNLIDSDALTALMIAAENGHLEAVRCLVNLEANLEAKDRRLGFTALIKALWNEHWHVANFLLESGSSPEPRGKDDFLPMSRASQLGKSSIVK